jgi:hypothetical protein
MSDKANAGSQEPAKKRIMRSFIMDEISGVDNPAQSDARVTLLKRQDGDHSDQTQAEQFGKQAALSASTKGHSHLIRLDSYDGMPLNEGETSHQSGHSHPWIRQEDGSIIIGEVSAHTHSIQALGKLSEEGSLVPSEDHPAASIISETPSQEDNPMTEKTADAAAEELKVLKAQLAKSVAINGLNVNHRTHFDGLDEAGQTAFLAKSVSDRDADIKAIELSKSVIYKSMDGEEFTAQDDPRLVSMAKRHDAERKRADEDRAKYEVADLRKRAETDLAGLPGTVEVRMSLLKAAESIPDQAERTAAVEALKAQSTSLAKAGTAIGYAGNGSGSIVTKSVDGSNAEAELDTLAKAYAKDHKVPEATAYDTVIQTGRGAELYALSLN